MSVSAQSALQVTGRPPLQSSPASLQHAAVMACVRVAMSLCEQEFACALRCPFSPPAGSI
eukprot:COSAG04_NODE_21652_length_370_cov_0.660517_1_plen_59_part_10